MSWGRGRTEEIETDCDQVYLVRIHIGSILYHFANVTKKTNSKLIHVFFLNQLCSVLFTLYNSFFAFLYEILKGDQQQKHNLAYCAHLLGGEDSAVAL